MTNPSHYGKRFGEWTVIGKTSRRDSGSRLQVLCQCSCGSEPAWKNLYLLEKGRSKSCGCLRAQYHSERLMTHGKSQTDIYRIWSSMITRCENPNSISYPKYGGSGVKVCAKWRDSFEAFAEDVGERPSKAHTLDRFPNRKGDYEPNNIRWATPKEQSRNTDRNILIKLGNRTLCLLEWCEIFEVSYPTVRSRIKSLGWEPIRALMQPVIKPGQRHEQQDTP